jgi:hypothetical protein
VVAKRYGALAWRHFNSIALFPLKEATSLFRTVLPRKGLEFLENLQFSAKIGGYFRLNYRLIRAALDQQWGRIFHRIEISF